jgi:hypothetical protein
MTVREQSTGFPRVETVHASLGLVVTRAELEALVVVAPTEKATPEVVQSPCIVLRKWSLSWGLRRGRDR